MDPPLASNDFQVYIGETDSQRGAGAQPRKRTRCFTRCFSKSSWYSWAHLASRLAGDSISKNFTIKERSRGNDTVLYFPGEDREILMTCNGFAVRRVAADATGYTALTGRFVILGDLASAPDLP